MGAAGDRGLGFSLPIQPAKGYSITFKKPQACPAVPLLLGEAKVGVTPMGGWLRFAGTLELAGLDLSLSRRRVEAILRAVPGYLPQVDLPMLELVEIWWGCGPHAGYLPFLGRAPGYKNSPPRPCHHRASWGRSPASWSPTGLRRPEST